MILEGPRALMRRCADKLRPTPAAQTPCAPAQQVVCRADVFELPPRVPTPVLTQFAPLPLMAAAAPRELYALQLRHIIDAINAPYWVVENADSIEEELTFLIRRYPGELEPYVWRGILKRLQGTDPRADFDRVLAIEPNHRLALLNHAAAPITCQAVRREGDGVVLALSRIERYLLDQPDDAFAALIAAALLHLYEPQTDAAFATLEALYLRHPRQAPTAAVMATLLQAEGRRHAASDFAREALGLDAHNAVAHNILKKNRAHEHVGDASHPFIRPPGVGSRTGPELVFMAPYAQQDLDYGASRETL